MASGGGGDCAAPIFLAAAAVESLLPLPSLVPHLQSTLPLSSSIQTPLRHHHSLPSNSSSSSSNSNDNNSLLLMPSWSTSPTLPYFGVKVLTSFPSNPHPLASIHSLYNLFDSSSGLPLASLDATPLTLLRTSAISSLASLLLSPPSPTTLLLAGAGSLAPYLVRAHLLVRPSLRRLLLWNRTPSRALSLLHALRSDLPGLEIVHVPSRPDLDGAVREADVICCATGSKEALVRGELVKGGAHVNLMGSHRPSMRECDDELIRRGRVFVDCAAAMEEAGEVVGAIQRGVIAGVEGTLVELVSGEKVGWRGADEVTVFKSVGSGAFDLIAAGFAYENRPRLRRDSKEDKDGKLLSYVVQMNRRRDCHIRKGS